LIAESATRLYALWVNKAPGFPATPPHQDNAELKATANVVTIWLALDPVDDANGCLLYIPGSHKLGFRPHGKPVGHAEAGGMLDYGLADESAGVPIHLQPGDAVAHHGTTIHWTGPNNSQRNRRAVTMVFRGTP
jgi:phytanoyl-CoA hydroxylase